MANGSLAARKLDNKLGHKCPQPATSRLNLGHIYKEQSHGTVLVSTNMSRSKRPEPFNEGWILSNVPLRSKFAVKALATQIPSYSAQSSSGVFPYSQPQDPVNPTLNSTKGRASQSVDACKIQFEHRESCN